MTLLYKLTRADHTTHGGCQWGEGTEHTAMGVGKLCTSGWLHAYTSPLLAVLLDPIHGNFGAAAVLWEAEGDVGKTDHGLKVGCTWLRTSRIIPMPKVTTTQRVAFGILTSRENIAEPVWLAWAERWLSGQDRSEVAAYRARAALTVSADWGRVGAWKWATYAAEAGPEKAAYGAAKAAGAAAMVAALDLDAIAHRAMEVAP
jgi:hypothetical protein